MNCFGMLPLFSEFRRPIFLGLPFTDFWEKLYSKNKTKTKTKQAIKQLKKLLLNQEFERKKSVNCRFIHQTLMQLELKTLKCFTTQGFVPMTEFTNKEK